MKLNPPLESRRVRTQPLSCTCLPTASTWRASETLIRSIFALLFLLVAHEDFFAMYARELLEAALDDHVSQLAGVAEVAVARRSARELAAQVLADEIGGRHVGLVLSTCGQRRYHDRNRVLNPRRGIRHATLPVGELQLMLAQDAGDIERGAFELVQCEIDMIAQPRVHRRHFRPSARR